MVRSSVQQDPRAPGDHWNCTPIFQPVEGALTSCPLQVSTTVVVSCSTFSLGLLGGLKLSCIASLPTLRTVANKEAAELRSEHCSRYIFSLHWWLYSPLPPTYTL